MPKLLNVAMIAWVWHNNIIIDYCSNIKCVIRNRTINYE